MAVKIRLKRTGAVNKPCFRIVVTDGRAQRDGMTIEEIGFYNPVSKEETINLDRFNYWKGVGAQPSGTVLAIATRCADPAKARAKPGEGQIGTSKRTRSSKPSKVELRKKQAEKAAAEQKPA